VDALAPLADVDLKGLLRRVVGRIFNEIEFQGWCAEQEKLNARESIRTSGSAS
jgi:hypothetical protein